MESKDLVNEEKEQLLALLLAEEGFAILPKQVITPREKEGDLPLSFAQQRLWVLDQLEPGNTSYIIPLAVRLRGPLHPAALEHSLNEIMRRHGALRTIFTQTQGQPLQTVVPPWSLALPMADLGGVTASEREIEVQRLLTEAARQPFDLARGPLIRASMLRLGTEEHLLLLTMHHIIADGWSLGVLMRELGMLYAAFLAGKPSPLPALPIQYADYALWQREQLQSAVFEEQLAYWRQQLQGSPPTLDLRTDRPRPPLQTFRGAHIPLLLSSKLSARLKTLSRQQQTTLFMTLLAAFKVLLLRYTGQEDIVVGTPVAGRNRSEIEHLIGFFLNTLVLRTDLSGNPCFLDVLQRVRKVTVDAYAHQDVPFERLLQDLQVERSLSYTPLFQIFFNMLNLPNTVRALPGLSVEMVFPADVASKFDLTLYVEERQDTLLLELVYNADLFEHGRMQEMLAQLHTLLRQMVEHPAENISRFSLVTAAARAVLPDSTAVLNTDWHGAIHTQFSRQARRVPDRIALVDVQGAWSYEALDRRSNQLAHYLLAHGIRPQDRVALYGYRNAAFVCAVLGVLKAGAVFSILDPAYPAARLLTYIEMMQPRGWIQIAEAGPLPELLEEYLAVLPDCCRLAFSTHMMDETCNPFREYATEHPQVQIGPDDLACISFTSGSTGKPKGVLGRHGPLTHFLPWQVQTFDLREDDHFSMLSGLSHDPLQRDIFTPFWLGATLYVPTPADIGIAGRLAAWMGQMRISVSHLTPAMIQLLTQSAPGIATPNAIPLEDALAMVAARGRLLQHLPTLRLALILGDAVSRDNVAQLQQVAPAVSCVASYGSTETQRAVGYFVVPHQTDTAEGHLKEIIPLGRLMQDVQLLVLHHDLQLAGIGEVGEIYVRSPHLARGYLDDDELTRQRFLPNPFTNAAGDRLYRTGDLGCYLANGTIEFLGRCDDQVKLRGFRIEPGEIEAALRHLPSVRDCLVMLREDSPGEKRLVAYIVPHQERSVTSHDLRGFLKERLPEYMIPAAFVFLEQLPLTPNGKIDRRALPLPDPSRSDLKESYVAARTPTEEILVTIWAQVLQASAIGVHDNFFELGGHSLLATQVISRIRDTFQIELPLRRLFEAATVAALARQISYQPLPDWQASAIKRVARDKDIPLSYAQQRLWFLDQLEPANPAYNLHTAIRLTGSLDISVLAQSLQEIIRRHEALRTTFTLKEGQPSQVIAAVVYTPLPIIDLRAYLEAEAELGRSLMLRLLAKEARCPFDLAQGPLVRVKLLRLAAEDHVLALSMHHIVSDGWSMGVFIKELAGLYEAFCQGKASPLSALLLQYADFASWQRRWLQGEVLQSQLAYWKKQLEDLPQLALPTDHPRPPVQTFRGSRQRFELPQHLSAGLKQLSRQQGVTLFMVLLAAWATLLSRYSGQEDLAIGSPIANRRQTEVEALIGCFVNTLVLRADLSGRPGFLELLRRVREACLQAYAHQDVPFEQLVEALAPTRTLSYSPLFQVVFVLQNTSRAIVELANLQLDVLPIESATTKFDLTLQMAETEQGLQGILEYNTDLFEATTIGRMLKHFQNLLEGILTHPEQAVVELPLLTRAEREQLLVEWNGSRQPAEEPRCIHELFEKQVECQPAAVALVWEEEQMTYEELNRRANQLAHYLRKLGVGPERQVGVCLKRSQDLVVALLAVLKAGGSYVPLDPAYPRERLAFILQDAQVAVLLAHQSLVEDLPQQEIPLVYLDADGETIATEPTTTPISKVNEHNVAYVIYTSGSTGQPKGVLISHANVVRLLAATRPRFDFDRRDVWSLFHSSAFDFSVWELWGALLHGGRLVVVPYEVSRSPEAFADLLYRQRISVLNQTPSAFRQLLAHQHRMADSQESSLRLIIFGGEALEPAGLRPWFARYGDQQPQLVNMYGITETTVHVSAHLLSQTDLLQAGRSVIGRPLPGWQVYVLDQYLQPMPIGVAGELYVGGVGLAHGYLNRADLTAQRFIPHPFSTEPGARLYKTGDIGRYLPDGELEYLGRNDRQVKLRGFRIELGEIEALLESHPRVRQSVVMLWEEEPARSFLVGYIVVDQQQGLTVSALHQYLKGKVPDYMVPATFVLLDTLPLTANGKLDRRALPAPGMQRPDLEETYVAPRTEREAILAEIWSQVLGIERVGVKDNFFEVGGDSIRTIQILARARERGLHFSLQQFFQHQTIYDLVQQLSASELTSPVTAKTQAFDLISPEDRARLQMLSNRSGQTDKGGL